MRIYLFRGARRGRTSYTIERNDHIGMIRFAYQEQGMYTKQLERYFKLFDSAQFYITTFDDLF